LLQRSAGAPASLQPVRLTRAAPSGRALGLHTLPGGAALARPTMPASPSPDRRPGKAQPPPGKRTRLNFR
ncbi:hypothetical protein ELE00_37160, partial [Klebsiella pneumoniae]|nr:hypothetical protein [Klebsiella pneumoniae]